MKNKKSSAIIYGSKATAAALEKFVKYVNNKDTRTISMTTFWCLQLRIYFTSFLVSSLLTLNTKTFTMSWIYQLKYRIRTNYKLQNPNLLYHFWHNSCKEDGKDSKITERLLREELVNKELVRLLHIALYLFSIHF